MTSAKRLFELQQIDTELHGLQKMADDINRQLAGSEPLAQAKSTLDTAQQHLRALEKQQKELEQDVAEIEETSKNLQHKLYGGTIKNPKELLGLEQELKSIKENQHMKEDIVLNLMTDIEIASKAVKQSTAQVATAKSEWEKEKTVLARKKQEIDNRIADFAQQRLERAGEIDPQTLRLYTTMRLKRGQAVARIEQGRCQGCRVSLSITELKQSRNSIVQCSSCGRILFAG